MKKLLILLLGAAIIGFVISKNRGSGPEPMRGEDAAASTRLASGSGGPELTQAEASASLEPMAGDAVPARALPVGPKTGEAAGASAGRGPVLLSATVPAGDDSALDTGPEPTRSTQRAEHALAQAAALLVAGKRIQARGVLTQLYLEARGEGARKLRELLDEINKELVFNPRCLEGAVIHVVEPDEVLLKIAKAYGVSSGMIARINGIHPDRVRPRQRLKILTGPTSLVVFKSEFRMALLIDGAYIKEYPIGIGKEDRTPEGAFVVDSMLVRPRWYPPEGGFIEYGEEGHLLGERWIGFRDEPWGTGLGVHGTDDEKTVGTKCSNGCLRMRNADVIELYAFVQMGTKVEIRN